jgi:hypothetical protein
MRQIEDIGLRVHDRFGVERLAAGEDMQAPPFSPCVDDMARKRRHALGIDAERLGPAAHLHARSLELEIGIDPNREARRLARPLGNGERALRLALAFQIERRAMQNGFFQLAVALARPGEADARAVDPGLSHHVQLAARRDVEPVDQTGHMCQHGREAVGLDGVIDFQPLGHGRAQIGDAARHHRARIDEERRSPRPLDQLRGRFTVHGQFAIARLVPRRDGSDRFSRLAHARISAIICCEIKVLSSFPFGFTGSVSRQWILCGCMKFGSSFASAALRSASRPASPRTTRWTA